MTCSPPFGTFFFKHPLIRSGQLTSPSSLPYLEVCETVPHTSMPYPLFIPSLPRPHGHHLNSIFETNAVGGV